MPLIWRWEQEHEALEAMLRPLSDEQMTMAGVCEGWSVKDILAHLLAWEQMVLGWYRAGLRGETPKTPAPDLNWSQIPLLNQRIYEQHRDRPLADVLADFRTSYHEMHETLRAVPEEGLFDKGLFKWTGTSTLGSYFVSSTSSHYKWARDLIRKWLKSRTG